MRWSIIIRDNWNFDYCAVSVLLSELVIINMWILIVLPWCHYIFNHVSLIIDDDVNKYWTIIWSGNIKEVIIYYRIIDQHYHFYYTSIFSLDIIFWSFCWQCELSPNQYKTHKTCWDFYNSIFKPKQNNFLQGWCNFSLFGFNNNIDFLPPLSFP